MYEQIHKNNDDSKNQLDRSKHVKIYNPQGKGLRVMFVGNSIAFHGVKEDIG